MLPGTAVSFLCVGLCIMAFGVGFSIKAGLGTSPISSVPYTVSCFTPLSVGTATIAMHCVFILIQILLLRKRYRWIQLMQLPVAVIFGYLTDFAVFALQGITCTSYMQQWICCLIGVMLVAVGVSFEVVADVVTLAGEGVVLGLIFLGRVEGVREGTVAAALLVGMIARQINGPLKKATARLLGGQRLLTAN